jgi:hypothetical protein
MLITIEVYNHKYCVCKILLHILFKKKYTSEIVINISALINLVNIQIKIIYILLIL